MVRQGDRRLSPALILCNPPLRREFVLDTSTPIALLRWNSRSAASARSCRPDLCVATACFPVAVQSGSAPQELIVRPSDDANVEPSDVSRVAWYTPEAARPRDREVEPGEREPHRFRIARSSRLSPGCDLAAPYERHAPVGWLRGPAACLLQPKRSGAARRRLSYNGTRRVSDAVRSRSGGGISIPSVRPRPKGSIYRRTFRGLLPRVKRLPTTRARARSRDAARTPRRRGAVHLR